MNDKWIILIGLAGIIGMIIIRRWINQIDEKRIVKETCKSKIYCECSRKKIDHTYTCVKCYKPVALDIHNIRKILRRMYLLLQTSEIEYSEALEQHIFDIYNSMPYKYKSRVLGTDKQLKDILNEQFYICTKSINKKDQPHDKIK